MSPLDEDRATLALVKLRISSLSPGELHQALWWIGEELAQTRRLRVVRTPSAADPDVGTGELSELAGTVRYLIHELTPPQLMTLSAWIERRLAQPA